MTITNGYTTLAEMKAADVLNISNSDHDTVIEREVEAVSRAIDEFCWRHFYQDTAARYYTPDKDDELYVDDIYSTSGLVIQSDLDGDGSYEYTWATTDYYLAPYNPRNGWPYEIIEVSPQGIYTFPLHRKSMKVTAPYGWSAVPAQVHQACILWALRLHKRYQTILGVSAASAVGTVTLKVPDMDKDVYNLLLPFRKRLS